MALTYHLTRRPEGVTLDSLPGLLDSVRLDQEERAQYLVCDICVGGVRGLREDATCCDCDTVSAPVLKFRRRCLTTE